MSYNDWEIFTTQMSVIFQCIFDFICRESHSLPTMFNPIPYVILDSERVSASLPTLFTLLATGRDQAVPPCSKDVKTLSTVQERDRRVCVLQWRVSGTYSLKCCHNMEALDQAYLQIISPKFSWFKL